MTTPRDPLQTVAPVDRLIERLSRLPGIGPKSAQRLTYHLIRQADEEAKALAEAVLELKAQVGICSVCQNVTDCEPCAICTDDGRDDSLICIVEEPLDVLALERTRVYKGRYHILNGVISPINGVGPEDLKVRELLERLRGGHVKEVILATNPTLEGEATAMYLSLILGPLGLRITQLARGLPSGGELEYADEMTLLRAFEGRQEFD